ncbi:MAG TPA: hypothetical protein ENH50_08495 [Nitrospirae bacterium]|nr:hypothetical protein [Nitrospirota bacterium]
MPRLIMITAFIITQFLCSTVWAATYYIDFNNGSDSNSGLSQLAAWKTLPGTRTTNDLGWQSTSWGGGTIDSYHKVAAGTVFELKRGTTHDSSNGGKIYIESTFYDSGAINLSNPVTIEVDTSWGSGNVVFDGSGINLNAGNDPGGWGLIHIEDMGGIIFDGRFYNGIVIRDSVNRGISVYSKSLQPGSEFKFIKFFNNGTGIPSDMQGASEGQLAIQYVTGGGINQCEFDGNNNYINGITLGESHYYVQGFTITNTEIYNHRGDVSGNDSGIGIKAYNSQVTINKVTSHNNLKGLDLGEQHGSTDINYKVLNSYIYSNYWGLNFSASSTTYPGTIKWYVINNIIIDNAQLGSNIYASPFDLYLVHNVYANNGSASTDGDYANINLSQNYADTWTINAYLYNNIFFKPAGGSNFVITRYDKDTIGMNVYSDYNSWVQKGSEYFMQWDYFGISSPHSFPYGATQGPGHDDSYWYTYYDYNTVAPKNGSLGHYHADSHSVGTGAEDTTLPPFTDIANHDYSLTSDYPGLDLTTQSWYIPEMGKDRNGDCRVTWDLGAFESNGQECGLNPSPPFNINVAIN